MNIEGTKQILRESGYGRELDLGSPAQFAADLLDRAAPSGAVLSVSEIAKGYRHINEPDFSRVRKHYLDGATDAQAKEWLIEQAILKMVGDPPKIVAENGGYRLADGVTLADLRFHTKSGKALPVRRPAPNAHARLGDRFNRMANSGEWADSIRSNGDLSELRESMLHHGWLEDAIFWAISDEHGVVLVGHRRLRVVDELVKELGAEEAMRRGIVKRVRPVTCGRGDAGDIKRLQFAVLSNIGNKSLTQKERQKIVAVLAGPNHDWTQMSIAEGLGVSLEQIGADIAVLEEVGESSETDDPQPPVYPEFSSYLPKTGARANSVESYIENPVVVSAIEAAIRSDRGGAQSSLGRRVHADLDGLGVKIGWHTTFREVWQRIAGRMECHCPHCPVHHP